MFLPHYQLYKWINASIIVESHIAAINCGLLILNLSLLMLLATRKLHCMLFFFVSEMKRLRMLCLMDCTIWLP